MKRSEKHGVNDEARVREMRRPLELETEGESEGEEYEWGEASSYSS